jgi:hypothetical protein
MTNSVSPAFKKALLKLIRKPTLGLEMLNEYWPNIEKQILKQRKRLSKPIKSDDPIRLRDDLLGPIARSSDETIHTRALAYLFNPVGAHGLRKHALATFLAKLPRGTGATYFRNLLLQKRTHANVYAEYKHIGRNDIRIKLRAKKNVALIVIENKIEAKPSINQLPSYEQEARKWCKKNKKARLLLVYLAPSKNRQPNSGSDRWVNLSYLELAAALRKVWLENPRAAGRAWLGLYIATITREVLGIDINRLQDTPLDQIETYLGKAAQ